MTPPTQLTDLFRMAIDRAEDDTFLQALRDDPHGAIRRTFGVTFVDSDILGDDELDGVVGGAGFTSAGLSGPQLEAFELLMRALGGVK